MKSGIKPDLPALWDKKSTRTKVDRAGPTRGRAADYAIQGFIYQFNKTCLAILDSGDNASIVVEGVIEDIDIYEPLLTTAIQCKYHEGQEAFAPSIIYKPVLQMLDHFNTNSKSNIAYLLFAHFPDKVDSAHFPITRGHIEKILATTNAELAGYTERLRGKVDIDEFLLRFKIEFGPSMERLVSNVKTKLIACGFSPDDVPTVIYPNAIHSIAELSTQHHSTNRRIVKADFLARLHAIKKITISKWTLALRTAKQILYGRRLQLKQNLSLNVRRRSFLISETAASDFKEGVVIFISDYLEKYHFKAAHTEPPLFCLDCCEPLFDAIRERIHEKGIKFTDGFIGPRFDLAYFARAPVVSPNKNRPDREFAIRLLRFETDPQALSTPKCDDLFVISTKRYPEIRRLDINEERLATETLQQVKYVLGVSDAYD
jgi:hypothetical protein